MQRDVGHMSVLRVEVVELLNPAERQVLLDCTVGLGGHAETLLDAGESGARLIGMDVDEANLRLAGHRLGRFGRRVRLFHANFTEARVVLDQAGVGAADLVLADLGAAATQLNDPERGLSFSRDGPLDMRMDSRTDSRTDRTAADLVNRLGQKQLADLIYTYGQERYSRRIAKAIVSARGSGPILRTVRLAEVVSGAIPPGARRKRRGVHPATRTFQALRIAVNDEMRNLDTLLGLLGEIVADSGVVGIISFHSLEDGRVKRAFADLAGTGRWKRLNKKPICATDDEVARNPRSRSAKLRGIQKLI